MTDLTWLALLLCWAMLSMSLGAATVVRRLVLGIPVLFSAIACALTLSSLMRLRLDLKWLLTLLGLLAGVSLACRGWERLKFADRTDGFCTLAAAMAAGVAGYSVIGASPGQLLATLSRATDGSRHLALGKAILQHHGYLTFMKPDGSVLEGLNHYPQGFGAALAVVLRAIGGQNPDNAQILTIALPFLALLFALLAWCSVGAVLRGSVTVLGASDVTVRGALLATAAITAVFVFGPELTVYSDGYEAQVLATIMLVCLLCVVFEPSGAHPFATTATVAVLLVGVAQSWYLLTPITLVTAGAYLREIPAQRGRHLSLITIALPFVAFPFLTGPSPGKQLKAFGAASTPTRLTIIALVLMAVGGWLLLRAGGHARRTRALTGTWVASFVLAVAVGAYQVATGTLGYYTQKMLVISLVMGSLVGAAALAVYFGVPQRSSTGRLLSGTVLVAVTATLLGSASQFLDRVGVTSAQRAHAAEANAFLKRHPRGLPKGVEAFTADQCRRSQDGIISEIFIDLSGNWSTRRLGASTKYMFAKPGDVSAIRGRIADPTVKRVEIYSHHPCRPDLLAPLQHSPKVVVITA